MAISYPTSLDSLTNPNTTDAQNSPSHAGQHSDANDAIEAIEAKVGTGSSTATDNTVLTGTGAGTSAWAQIATGDIADSAVSSRKMAPTIGAASNASTVTTTNTTYTDITSVTFSFTTAVTSTIMYWFTGQLRRDAASGANGIKILRDATTVQEIEVNPDTADKFNSVSMVKTETSVAAGTYTIKAQFKDATGQTLGIADASLVAIAFAE